MKGTIEVGLAKSCYGASRFVAFISPYHKIQTISLQNLTGNKVHQNIYLKIQKELCYKML